MDKQEAVQNLLNKVLSSWDDLPYLSGFTDFAKRDLAALSIVVALEYLEGYFMARIDERQRLQPQRPIHPEDNILEINDPNLKNVITLDPSQSRLQKTRGRK